MTNSISTFLLSVQNFSKFAYVNQVTQSLLSENQENSSGTIALKSIHTVLAAMLESEPNIDSVIIELNNGDLDYSPNLTNVSQKSLSEYPKDKIAAARGGAVWGDTFRSVFLSKGQSKNIISLSRVIVNMENGKPLGYLYVNIDERVFAQLYESDQNQQSRIIMITNSNGMIVSSNEPSRVNESIKGNSFSQWINESDEGSKIFNVAGKGYLISFKRLTPIGWNVIYLVPTSVLSQGFWKIALLVIIYGLISILTAISLSVVFSSFLTKPLIKLSKVIVEVGAGNFKIRAPVETKDEVGQLGKTFNKMVDRIQELVFRVEEEEKKKRLLELRLLYSQIKPHFLYNTLDMIRSMAIMADAKEISNVVKALGDFFRISLSNGQELITVKQEHRHLKSYLYIQQMRVKKLQYRIDFQPDIENCLVPTMLLQPLVENAIHHGIREMPEGGLCEIIGYEERDGEKKNLCFIVRDNGKGMSREQQERIWSSNGGEDLFCFGLKNIQDRIRLRFGECYGIVITSDVNKGVEVMVRMPFISKPMEISEVDK